MVLLQERKQITVSYSPEENVDEIISSVVKQVLNENGARTSNPNRRLLPAVIENPGQNFNRRPVENTLPPPVRMRSENVVRDFVTSVDENPMVRKRRLDPLVFDLIEAGEIRTTPMNKVFNITGKGSSLTGWVAKGMGLLAFDVDNDGTQGKDGRSLIGNFSPINGRTYANGFEALKALAKKHILFFSKNKLEKRDIEILEEKAGLCMLLDNKKLSLVKDLKITEISLVYDEMGANPDKHGNQHRQRSSFIRNGKKQLVEDIWFKYTVPMNTKFGNQLIKDTKEINFMLNIAQALGY